MEEQREVKVSLRERVTILDVNNGIVGFDIKIRMDGKFIGTYNVIVEIPIEEAREFHKTKAGLAFSKDDSLADAFQKFAEIMHFTFDHEGELESLSEAITKRVREYACLSASYLIDRHLEIAKKRF